MSDKKYGSIGYHIEESKIYSLVAKKSIITPKEKIYSR